MISYLPFIYISLPAYSRSAIGAAVQLGGAEDSVKRVAMLITPDGEWVLPGSGEFFEKLGDARPDYDAEGFAVRNLGFIRFSMIERTIVEIELHPRNVALPALLAVQQQIQAAGVRLFRIKYFEEAWQSEITSSAEQAMVRLSQLTAPTFVEPSGQRFVVEPRDYTQLLMDETNELRPLAQKWRMSFGRFDSSVISFAINHKLLQRMLIIGVRGESQDPIYRFIGEGHSTWLDRRYHASLLGERLGNIPDKDYAEWAGQFQKDVARTGQPRFDCVTAAINRPPNTYRSRYERLLLPWTTSGDEILVTVCNRRLCDEGALSLAESDSSAAKNSLKSA
jgi:hypothetical protein